MAGILLLGGSGQLGRELAGELQRLGLPLTALSHAELDITDRAALAQACARHAPQLLINAGAYTNVEQAEAQPELAFAINAAAPGHMAQLCGEAGIPLLHVSTDYVFDHGGPHREGDEPQARGMYARSKLRGEQLVAEHCPRALILRVSWLFGRWGSNFVKTMLRLGRSRSEVGVVCDQLGAPTPARALAADMAGIARRLLAGEELACGLYHYCGEPYCSWADLARAVFAQAQALGLLDHEVTVRDLASADYPTRAPRPSDSRLDCTRIREVLGVARPQWAPFLAETLQGTP